MASANGASGINLDAATTSGIIVVGAVLGLIAMHRLLVSVSGSISVGGK